MRAVLCCLFVPKRVFYFDFGATFTVQLCVVSLTRLVLVQSEQQVAVAENTTSSPSDCVAVGRAKFTEIKSRSDVHKYESRNERKSQCARWHTTQIHTHSKFRVLFVSATRTFRMLLLMLGLRVLSLQYTNILLLLLLLPYAVIQNDSNHNFRFVFDW